MYFEEIFYTHQENQAQHIPVLKCSQDSEFHRRKIIIIVKIIVLIIILAKTSLNTCDASKVLYFYKITCEILLHFHKLYNISYGLPILIQSQMYMYTHSENLLWILLTDTFKCLYWKSLHLSLTLLLFKFYQINKTLRAHCSRCWLLYFNIK